jgi:predicted secreted hydrolase
MIPFQHILEIRALADDDGGAVLGMIAPNGGGIGLTAVDGDHLRDAVAVDRLREKARGGLLIPRLGEQEIEGTIEIEGERFAVSGPSWFDRQYGTVPGFFKNGAPKDSMRWLWMNLQLSNGQYFSLTEITEFHEKRLTIFAFGINDEGAHVLARVNPIEKLDYWKSPVTGQNYPTRFKIEIPSLDARFEVTCTPKQQEIVSKLAGLSKYEGAADVTGTYRGE